MEFMHWTWWELQAAPSSVVESAIDLMNERNEAQRQANRKRK